MPSRSEMDMPAMVVVLVLGVVLIVATVPFLDDVGSAAGGSQYLIGWTSADEAEEQTNLSGNSATGTVEVDVEDVIPSVAVIEFDPCDDNFTPPVQQGAQISWVLRWEEHEESGTATCGDDPIEVQIEPQPDIGSVTAGSQSGAATAAYAAAGMNETVTFTLEVTVTRPAGQAPNLPLPVGQASFSATARLTIEAWNANASDPDAEVPR